MRMSRTVVCSGKNKKAVKSTMATCSCYVLQILQETLAAVVGRSVVCGLRVNWRHACFSTTLSAMGACKSAESENNVRQMTDLLLNPPTLQAKSSEWSWSEYFLPACPPHPLPPGFNFLNVVINKKKFSHSALSSFNFVSEWFECHAASFSGYISRQMGAPGSITIHSMTETDT